MNMLIIKEIKYDDILDMTLYEVYNINILKNENMEGII